MKDIFITNQDLYMWITITFLFAICFVVTFVININLKNKIDNLKKDLFISKDSYEHLNKIKNFMNDQLEKDKGIIKDYNQQIKNLHEQIQKIIKNNEQIMALNIKRSMDSFILLSKKRTRGIYTSPIPLVGSGEIINMHHYIVKVISYSIGHPLCVPLFVTGLNHSTKKLIVGSPIMIHPYAGLENYDEQPGETIGGVQYPYLYIMDNKDYYYYNPDTKTIQYFSGHFDINNTTTQQH